MSPRTAASLALVLLLPVVAAAQATPAGTLYGYVLDPDHRPLPGARVTVENPNTAAVRGVVSNQQGLYSVPALAPGSYNITVDANGFKTIHQERIMLSADENARLDFSLTIGSRTDATTVKGGAPLINTSDATVSTLIGNQFVENLPMNGRTFSTLIDLAPGGMMTPTNQTEQGQFSVNGQRPDAKLLHGGWRQRQPGNYRERHQPGPERRRAASGGGCVWRNGQFRLAGCVAGVPHPDFNLRAREYGHTPGAQVSLVTKSGTNTFHSTELEYFRNDALDANNWFANNLGISKPGLRQNDFGGVLGGPIKKDKLFFFGSYEGLSAASPESPYVRAQPGDNPERARSRPAVAQCLSKTDSRQAGLRQWNGAVYGQLLLSLLAELLQSSH